MELKNKNDRLSGILKISHVDANMFSVVAQQDIIGKYGDRRGQCFKLLITVGTKLAEMPSYFGSL